MKKLPSEIRAMPFPHAKMVLDYWMECPPESEMMVMFARVYTNWEPPSRANISEAEVIAEHRASLELRWKAGAMNPKQMYEALGGRMISADGTASMPFDFNNPPGIGPFPGAH